MKALPGFFNLIAFSLDPAVYNVVVTITKLVSIFLNAVERYCYLDDEN